MRSKGKHLTWRIAGIESRVLPNQTDSPARLLGRFQVQDYSISKSTRRCAVSNRPLEPGESYVSAITSDGENVQRVDIAQEAWEGPQEDTVGWWKCRMPDADKRKLKPAPNGVLLDTLAELLEHPDSQELAYLLALMLVRRRVLQDEDSIDDPASDEASLYWSLVCNADKRTWHVPVVESSAAQLNQLREQLQELLFTEE